MTPVRKAESEWQVYRTRFLIRAKQLTAAAWSSGMCSDVNIAVKRGDYLIESSDGTQRIAPREIFEDIYVAMGSRVRSEESSSR